MIYNRLGKTDLQVSLICLGTMTWGQQNSEKEAHEQLDFALARGINFIDTAELYSVPSSKETQGLTEKYIGSWLKKSGKRNEIILATKITGPAKNLSYISPNLGFSKDRIQEAIDLSLQRLSTDYIDLYQLHWPERSTNYFGRRGYNEHDAEWQDNILDSIQTLQNLKKSGKIRHFGISNETPWGVHRYLTLARENGHDVPVSIQNPYSLLNRTFEIGLAEMAIRENVGLLAYSPLAMGMLSGKYLTGKDKPENRLNQFKYFSRYTKTNAREATQAYLDLAKEYNFSLTQMALAFVNQQEFLTSNIIGATDLVQLEENIQSIEINLNPEVLQKINEIHEKIPNPTP